MRVNIARPGPPPDIGNALVIDRNYCDALRGSVTGSANAKVVSLPLETLDEVAAGCDEYRERDNQPEEPIGFPKSRVLHATHPVGCLKALIYR